MSEITLEKIDIIRERTKATYKEAKEALEICDGNIVDALIYIEEKNKSTKEGLYVTKDEFINWVKDLINKGNINRIKIKKGKKVIADIPVNAGVAATAAGIWLSPLITVGIFALALTRVSIEITKKDGSVEIINKVIKNTVSDIKEKVEDKASEVKEKFSSNKQDEYKKETMYSYTVNFEDVDEEDAPKKDEE